MSCYGPRTSDYMLDHDATPAYDDARFVHDTTATTASMTNRLKTEVVEEYIVQNRSATVQDLRELLGDRKRVERLATDGALRRSEQSFTGHIVEKPLTELHAAASST